MRLPRAGDRTRIPAGGIVVQRRRWRVLVDVDGEVTEHRAEDVTIATDDIPIGRCHACGSWRHVEACWTCHLLDRVDNPPPL